MNHSPSDADLDCPPRATVVARARGTPAPRFAAALLGLFLLAGAAAAQTPEPSPAVPVQGATGDGERDNDSNAADDRMNLLRATSPVSQPGAVDPRVYRLGPGDVLQLDLWGRVVRSISLEVSPEGKIFLPGSEPLQVAGQTLEWTRQQMVRLTSATFRGVSTDLRLMRLRTFKVYVSGEVAHPGAAEVTSMTHASEVLSRSGLQPTASRREIELHHRDGSSERVDLLRFELTGNQETDPMLLDGDVLVVGPARHFVTMYGAVARPRQFEIGANDSLSGLLRLAGGMQAAASLDSALLVRFGDRPTRPESLHVDLRALVEGRWDTPVVDGDRFFTFFQANYHLLPTVQIVGEVNRPGVFPIVLGKDRLSDLVRWASGFGPRANQAAIYVVRNPEGTREQNPEFDRLSRLSRDQMTGSEYATLQTQIASNRSNFIVDWHRISQRRAGSDLDPLLRDGDLVRVDPLVTSIRVQGEVRHPGLVEYRPSRTWNEYVQLAGGFTDRASRGQVRVSRSLTGQIVPARSLGELEPGDFIWVPERKDIDPWAIFRDVVLVAGQIAVIIVAARK